MITVEWANENKRVIRWHLSDAWTWAEFYDAQKEVDAMIDTVDGIVDGIFVTNNRQYLPPNALTHLRKITLRRHKRYGFSFVVGARTFITALLNLLSRIMPSDDIIFFVRTEEQALARIKQAQQKRLEPPSISAI